MVKKINNVAMIGIGSVGGFIASRLFKVLGPDNFRIIADDDLRQQIERDGFIINGERIDFPIVSSDEQVEPADLVLIAVKHTHLDGVIEQIANQVGPHTTIMSLLNGVDSEDKVAARYGEAPVLHSFMRITAGMVGNVVDYKPDAGVCFFGEKDKSGLTDRVLAVQELMEKAAIPYRLPEDILHAQWLKFMTNVSENLICAIIGVGYSLLQRSEHSVALRLAAAREVIAVANKQGIPLCEDDIKQQEEWIVNYDPYKKPSTQQDIEQKRRTEIEMFAGQMVRMGKKYGVPVPVSETMYHIIKLLEQKNEGIFE